MQHCCILQYDFITVFITAGVRREPAATAGTINIIVCSTEGMEDAALLESIMVIAEAKAEALQAMDLPLTGTPTDAVIVGCEGAVKHRYGGRSTDTGMRIRESVLHGIPEAVSRHDAAAAVSPYLFFHFQPFQRRALGPMDKKGLPVLSLPLPRSAMRFLLLPVLPVRGRKTWEMGRKLQRQKGLELCRVYTPP